MARANTGLLSEFVALRTKVSDLSSIYFIGLYFSVMFDLQILQEAKNN